MSKKSCGPVGVETLSHLQSSPYPARNASVNISSDVNSYMQITGFSCFPQWDTTNDKGKSINDAGRVGDPTSMVRPCKSPEGGRSLVLVNQLSMCLVEELQSDINR